MLAVSVQIALAPNLVWAQIMNFPGKRFKKIRLIQSRQYVVAVEVEMVIPDDDPSKACYEAETVQYLREVHERAEQNDLGWLKQHGKVYEALGTDQDLSVP